MQLNIKNKNKKTEQKTFLQRQTNGKQAHERCLPIIREIKIRTIVRYHLRPVRMAIKKSTNNTCWRGCREKGRISYSVGNVK